MFCFYDGAAQGSELRLQKLPQSEDHWKEGLLSSLGSLPPVPSLQGWVTRRTRAQDGPLPKDPRDTRIVGGATGLDEAVCAWNTGSMRMSPDLLWASFLIRIHLCRLLCTNTCLG